MENRILLLPVPGVFEEIKNAHILNLCAIRHLLSHKKTKVLRIVLVGDQPEKCTVELLCEYYAELLGGSMGCYGDFLIILPWCRDPAIQVRELLKQEEEKFVLFSYDYFQPETPLEAVNFSVDDIKKLQTKEDKEIEMKTTKVFNSVSVGGTFDRMHVGHTLLLSLVLLVHGGSGVIIVGISGPPLLKRKKFKEMIYPGPKRRKQVFDLMKKLSPDKEKFLQVQEILDGYGPTIRYKDLHSIVVSEETIPGGKKINKIREEKKWNPLELVVIPCIVPKNKDAKVSSSQLRGIEFQKERSKHLFCQMINGGK